MGLASTFTNSIVREIGRNYGKSISNDLLGDLKLFDHYRQFFDENVIQEFKHNLDKSFKGHRTMMRDIATYIQENIKYDSKANYYNLVDTLKKLAENDV